MAVTNVRGRQLRDDDVFREDLNTTTTGRAVVRKVIQGTGLSFSSTGIDAGTGDVTITLATSGVTAGTYGGSSSVPVVTVDTYGRITSISTSAISGGGGTTVRNTESFTATAGQTLFTTTNTLSEGYYDVYLNGVRLNTSSYTGAANSVTLVDGATLGDIIDIIILGNLAVAATLPSQTGNAGKYLTTDGSNLSWASITAGSGTVTSVSVASANGFAGTVATATTTPAITISTTVTGILKGNGTAVSAAVSNTDYQAVITLTTTGSSGASTFNGTTLNIPTYTLTGLGGFANPMTTLGDIIYGGASGAATRLAGNTTSTKNVLLSTGNGTTAAAPAWGTLTASDVGAQASSTNLTSLAGLTFASTSFVKMTATGTFALDTNTYYLASNPSGYTSNTGTVTSVSVTTANGVSGTVATASTTPAITITLGAITPTTVNGLTFTAAATGFTIAGGTTSKTLTLSNTLTLAGTDGSTLNIGSGGTLGSAAFTASTAYQASSTNLTSLAGLTYVSASFVKMTAAGTFALDTASYLPLTGGTLSGNLTVNVSSGNAAFITTGSGTVGGANYFDFLRATTNAAGATNATKTFRLNNTGAVEVVNSAYSSVIFTLTDAGAGNFASSVTASSIIKSGGTSAQILAADGSVITAGSGISISGGTISATAGGGGTVTSVSVVSANGFAGTVATASTTPAITLTTTITGLLKGNGTAISAAVAGTDYQGASTNLTSLAGLTFASTSFVKMTAAGTFALDTNTYYLASNPNGYTSNSGTVTTVSVASANGFAGTVATATSTPAITISTTVTGLLKGNGTAVSAAVANTDYLAVASPAYTGTLTTGTLGFTAANPLMSLQSSVNGFNQFLIQNSSTGVSASSDVIVNNNLSTDTTYYGDFGINGSNYSGTGSFSLPNAVYLYSNTGDLSIGTFTSNAIHFVINNGTSDAATIKTTGQLQLPGYTTTSSFSGTAAGYLAFDSSGNIITVAAPTGGSAYSVTSVSTTYSETATSGTKVIKASTAGGSFVITLPTAVGNTATIIIKKTAGTADLTIDGAGSETIDGGTTAILRKVDESITLVSDNANWLII